jgi:uncharacterized protein DUF664
MAALRVNGRWFASSTHTPWATRAIGPMLDWALISSHRRWLRRPGPAGRARRPLPSTGRAHAHSPPMPAADAAARVRRLDAGQLARRAVEPSTMSLLGLVRHMAEVERGWFGRRFAELDIPKRYQTGADPTPTSTGRSLTRLSPGRRGRRGVRRSPSPSSSPATTTSASPAATARVSRSRCASASTGASASSSIRRAGA